MASSGAIKGGEAYVELSAKDNKLIKSLRNSERRMKSFGASIGKIGGVISGVGAGTMGLFLHPINSASDLQETMAKFDVVFAENKAEVKGWSDAFAAEVGRSKQMAADFLAGTQDLLVPMGFDSKSALDASKTVTQLAVDLASFNNKNDEDVLRDLHAALTGGGETVKKYGVILNVAAQKAELLKQGLDPKTATAAQKAQASLSIILKSTTAAQGDAVRSGDAYANMLKRVQGNIKDAGASVGAALLPMLSKLFGHVSTGIKWVGKFADENKGLIKTIFIAGGVVGGLGVALVALGATVAAAGFVMGGLATALTMFGTIAAGAFGLLFSKASLVAALVSGSLYAAFKMFIGQTETFQRLKDAWADTFDYIVGSIKDGDLGGAWALLMAALKVEWIAGLDVVKGYWMDFTDWIGGHVDTAWKTITDALPESWKDSLTKMMGYFGAFIGIIEKERRKTVKNLSATMLVAYGGLTGQDMSEEVEMLNQTTFYKNENKNLKQEFEREAEEKAKAFFDGPDENEPKSKRKTGDSPELVAAKKELDDLKMKALESEDGPAGPAKKKAGDAVAAANKKLGEKDTTRNVGSLLSSSESISAIATALTGGESQTLLNEQKKQTEQQKKTNKLQAKSIIKIDAVKAAIEATAIDLGPA